MPRIALVVPATTYRAGDFLDAAARLGAEVVVASDHRPTLASVMGDGALRLDLRRPEDAAERLAEHAAHTPLDAVVGVDDRGVEVAALASERLALAHSPAAAVHATRDKARMRARFDEAESVRQPPWRPVRTPDEAARAARDLGAPVVVKPVSLSASRGVIRADSPDEAAGAAARTAAICAEAGEPADLLVEQYVPGTEVALEGLVQGGRLRVLALFDKPDPLEGPYFEETLYVTPSRLPAATQQAVEEAAQAAVEALGLTDGPVHAEFRISGPEVWILELAARTIGGLCGRTLRFGVGMSLEEVVLRHALGLPLHALGREGAATGVLMLPIERAGVLREVAGTDDARAVPGIESVEITVPPGTGVRPLPEADRYLGFVFARGRTPQAVESALRTAHGRLDVRIEAGDPGPAECHQEADEAPAATGSAQAAEAHTVTGAAAAAASTSGGR